MSSYGKRVFESRRLGIPQPEPPTPEESLRAFFALLRLNRALAGLDPEPSVDRTQAVVIRKGR